VSENAGEAEPAPAAAVAHYFEPEPSVASAPREVRLALPDVTLDLVTDRGVFAKDEIDPGSKLLLLEAPPASETGALLDLGCGYGTLALPMAARSPDATVWAVDVNRRAVELCAENARRNVLDNVRAVTPEDVPEDLRFATIWSNPPIRIGKPALHDLLRSWLPRLDVGGEAIVVVHKHLGSDSLASWLEQEGWAVDRLKSRMGYRILSVTR
jgi:16S rRNA (guanine1207-N2)-methyltransferase